MSRRALRPILALLLLLGLALVIWPATQVAREQALSRLHDEADNELRLSVAGLRGHLSRHEYLPQLLASREPVQRFLEAPSRHSAQSLNLLLDGFRAIADVSDVYLLDRHADTLAASNWHRPDTFIGQNYTFRSYYSDAIAGREGRFYGLGVQSLERGYYFSAPVWLPDDEREPAGVMVVKVLLDAQEAAWAEQQAELLVVDGQGIIFMASQPELRLAALKPLSDAERRDLLATRRYADESLAPSGLRRLEPRGDHSDLVTFAHGPLRDQTFLRQVRPLPELGWEMHILKPLTAVQAAQWQAALLAGGLYGILVLGAGVGWQRLRLRRQREHFAERERQTLAQARDELERNVARRTRDLVESNRRLSDEIEERRRAEATLRQTQDELIQAAKLALLGQLAAGINHELNQPLAAVRSYAENARAFLARQQAERADANLAEIVELTGRMAEISAQLKQFSRKSGEQLTSVSVGDCFGYALRLYRARLDQDGVRVERRWPEAPVWVRADLVRLEQVLVNLIGNALQAMAQTPSPRLILGIDTLDDEVRIEVTDNGPGIPESQLSRIFEPFFTTKSPGTGLGLGLSISSRIIADLSGRLGAENLPEGGARFTIRLPRDRSPEASEPPSTQERHSHG
ncbi:sensor histidine kinase [Halomonas sp. 328]|uniref:sensor histidine kinase n=1 Tax=Halomonas sp. 328 TaxID=2776704 RepID=UPI0018A792CE|nr:ATP-binding protein [Halomonas sp. 328]MBF8224360.1 sensor histidine kinase [Halomonas sp. 328]